MTPAPMASSRAVSSSSFIERQSSAGLLVEGQGDVDLHNFAAGTVRRSDDLLRFTFLDGDTALEAELAITLRIGWPDVGVLRFRFGNDQIIVVEIHVQLVASSLRGDGAVDQRSQIGVVINTGRACDRNIGADTDL